MTNEEIYSLISQLGIPAAYNHFDKKIQPPFVLYTDLSPDVLNADDYNYMMYDNYQIELVTDKKDIVLEKQLETLLNNNHIPFEKLDDIFDDSERIYIITYEI